MEIADMDIHHTMYFTSSFMLQHSLQFILICLRRKRDRDLVAELPHRHLLPRDSKSVSPD